MVLTPSAMVALGTPAPDFALPDTTGKTVSRSDFDGKPLLVAFICNHCPYVKHIADAWAGIAKRIQDDGVAVVAINSNDADNYPDDAPDKMRDEAAARGYTFPYLFDETQDVARAYEATCTPDFFLYDDRHRLVYRGQLDGSRPGNGVPVTGQDLLAAVAAMQGGEVLESQVPSMGCNIKWKP